jgi:mannan endo-1,4-beta-mannosidase
MDMIERVHTDTGKYPALKGFDLIQLPYDGAPYYGGKEQIDEAIEWWEGKNNGRKLLTDSAIHGIVALCWHWRAGESEDFYTDRTGFRIPWKNGELDTASNEFKEIEADLEKVSELLKILHEKDIPVLWRPLHEASGGWFWWGASGAAAYKALWEYVYKYLTNTKNLNNLVWVWNGQSEGWYPDPRTVDIASYDVYDGARNYSSQKAQFYKTAGMVSGAASRIVALSENGSIPDPDKCETEGAMWSWFMTWNDGSGSQQGATHQDNFWTGEYHNESNHKRKVYTHERVITLDEVPDLTEYRLE